MLQNICKNADLSQKMAKIYSDRKVESCTEEKNGLIYTLCASRSPHFEKKIDLLVDMIMIGKIKNKQQLKLAEEFIQKQGPRSELDLSKLEEFCGVGILVDERELESVARSFVHSNIERIKKSNYRLNNPDLLNDLKRQLPYANPADLIHHCNMILDTLKPEELPDSPKIKKAKSSQSNENKELLSSEECHQYQKVDISKLVARDVLAGLNSPEIEKAHLIHTQGKVITRFPPEPNGILHIGHARAIRFNFSIAGVYGGECNLRYDDTNPQKEKKEYMDLIEDNVKWMGFKPTKTAHASHYFEKIHELTIELIKKGKAYVCKLSQEDMKSFKQEMVPSPFRDASIESNLKEFELMRRGYYNEGEAVLRAKIDYKSPNTTLRDPVIYRIIYTPHPVTNSTWCIYPMYDYAHPLSDSLENITHSCCSLEFETRRDLYYWPLQELNLYKPFVWEFSRLNLTYTITSKRRISRLIEDGIVCGWNDPRLFTIDGLKRRGVPVEALNEFLDRVPVTRRGNENYIQMELFDNIIRGYLSRTCERYMGVVDPVMVRIVNIEDVKNLRYEALKYPADPKYV